jgi:serine/threonine-protein kinase
MASVWLGRDELLGRRVAVKTLHPDLAVDEDLRGRFRQEAVAAAALSHPNIVATYDTGEDDGIAFIVMELVEGESLRQLLDRRRVLDPTEACEIAHQVAAALEHAHRQGVVHRDIKPANVLVPREGPVKVTDFGIAKATGGVDYTRTGMVVGTAKYLAPEQVQGYPTDARADVYALGLVLYEMLAGRPAFSGDTEMATALARLTGPPIPITEIRPGISPALASVIDQTLQPDPAHRIPSAAAFDAALRRALHEGTPAAPPSGTQPARARSGTPAAAASAPGSTPRPVPHPSARRPPARRRHPWRIALFLVFLAALGTASGLVTALVVSSGDDRTGGSSPPPVITSIRDFDPPPGDGRENSLGARFAFDGDATTAWNSESYESRDLGGIKPGVGLVVELEGLADVRAVEIEGEPGADVEIYVATSAGGTLAEWGPVRGRATDLADRATVTLDQPVRGQAVLVWFTRTPPSGRIQVRELRVV